MAVDLTKPLWILALEQQGEKLAILGGGNDEAEARVMAAYLPNVVLLRAERVEIEEPADG